VVHLLRVEYASGERHLRAVGSIKSILFDDVRECEIARPTGSDLLRKVHDQSGVGDFS